METNQENLIHEANQGEKLYWCFKKFDDAQNTHPTIMEA